jgi:ATP adenylyltransferase
VTQIESYTERVKRMVSRVLTGNGITEVQTERDELLQLCRQRLDAFRVEDGNLQRLEVAKERTAIRS